MEHRPVLLEEVVGLLVPALTGGGVFVDATLGRAGHALGVLQRAPRAQLLGIDRDPVAVGESRARLSPYAERVRVIHGNFEDLPSLLERHGAASVRGVLLDLGVSSPQMDDPGRGFGYRASGPLDMRMDPSQSLSAAEVVNDYSREELERVIARYGEERFARRIAGAVVAARPLATTDELAAVVRAAIPAAARRTGGHPARRTFQALRIEVNGELRALEGALAGATEALDPGGRVAVISYHSLEDRLVKRHFSEQSRGCVCPPEWPICTCGAHARLRVLTRRPVRPSEEEVETNPRARSARLRAAERLAVTENRA